MIDLAATTAGTGLDVRAAVEGTVLEATFTGEAEMPAYEAMQTIVGVLHAQAVEHEVREVVVDFTRLDFMSSSCFKCLVTWITEITDLPEGDRYKIRFRSSTAQLWQRRSLHVLQTFATDLVLIET